MAELMQGKWTITLAALVYCLQMSLKILSWTIEVIFFFIWHRSSELCFLFCHWLAAQPCKYSLIPCKW